MKLLPCTLGLLGLAALLGQESQDQVRALALEFSPLPPVPADPTNAVYESEAAARLGQALFYDERLSGPGNVSCATCHDPAQSFTDGRELAEAVAHLPRHTMTLWNVAYERWFFWDGRKDTLWSQALGPLEDPREHASSRLEIAHALADDPDYVRAYSDVFGAFPDLSDDARFPPAGRPVPEQDGHPQALAWASMTPADQEVINRVFSNVGKAIAAFERQLVSRDAPFDRYVAGLRSGDPGATEVLSESARRGLALFVGKGRCHLCHDGPNFTDGEFHTNLVPTGEGVDPGRPLGIHQLMRDPFNSRSKYADDNGATGGRKLELVPADAHVPGEFKTPTLRNVARTAPYMHEGQIATLADVVEFYSTLENAAAPRVHGEKLIQPLHLTDQERADLVAFLESLTDEDLPEELLAPPARPFLPR